MLLDILPVFELQTPPAVDLGFAMVNLGVGLAELFDAEFSDEPNGWQSVWGLLFLFLSGYLFGVALL